MDARTHVITPWYALNLAWKTRLHSIARWVAPSAVAACVGSLVAGFSEALAVDTAGIATVGFLAIVTVPLLLVVGVVARGVVAGWRPRLVDGIVEPSGGAPRLLGWIATIGLVCAIVAGVVYEGTWVIARHTDFQAQVVGFVEPVIVVCITALVFAASRPTVDLISHLARLGDARWRRGGRASLLRPRTILIAAAAVISIGTYATWRIAIKPQIGPLDTSVLSTPLVGLVATWLAHVGYRKTSRRGLASITVAVLAAATIVVALVVRATQPAVTIEIWGDRAIAGLAVDLIYDIDEVRADISLAEFRPVDRPGATHPDIVLVTIDTVRADHTPPYGGKAEMPALRDLGERGAVFDWAFAPSNVTRRSIPSMVIGYAPHRIRGRVIGWALRVDPRFVLLAERLRAGGYETAGFMCCPGFWGPEAHTGLGRGLEHLEVEHDGKQLAGLARAWLSARETASKRAPLFVWIHLLEPHNWTHGGSAPTTQELRDTLYDRSLAQADTILAQLLQPFKDRPSERAPIVIVTADHGEALGDHGTPFHSSDLYNSQLHVPFVVSGPGIPAAHLPETVSLTDLVPTVIELAGFEAPAKLDGRSLAEILTGKRASANDTGSAFAIMVKDRSNPGGLAAVIRGRWKLIVSDSGNVELYDVQADPRERANVADQHPEIVQELRPLLDAKLALESVSPF